MKRILLLLLTLCVLLFSCGCLRLKLKEPQERIEAWLEKEFSFSFQYEFTNLAYNGIAQETVQKTAEDGSFCMINTRREWHHFENYDVTEVSRFYYQYEDAGFVCYSQIGEESPQRMVMTKNQILEMNASKLGVVGSTGIFPAYIKNFALVEGESEENTCTYYFEIPVKDVLEDEGIALNTFLSIAISFSRLEYTSPQDVDIVCNIVVDKETHRPISLTYDFSEFKPYVLPDDVLLVEEMVEGGFMQMKYAFDYNLEETVPVPGALLSMA